MGAGDPHDVTTTLEHGPPEGGAGAPRVLGPLLVRLACADDLTQPSARWAIAPFSEVEIGRAGSSPAPGLRIEVRDGFASSRHARLIRSNAHFCVTDEGSRNGTLINGERVRPGAQVELTDRDLLEIGHTFFLFRGAARGLSEADLQPAATAEEPATYCPEWELELAKAARLARTMHEILIEGESGAGKEVLARFLHQRSGRAGPMVSVNCGALPETLFDDELFGHVRGAFSGAQAERQGLIRAADGGTLFLDEVGEMPPGLQVKLLRVLEDHQVRPIGSEREIAVDVRVIAASNRSLPELVAQGKFREDLLARLGLLGLRVVPLWRRREDMGLLIRAVLREGVEALDQVAFDLDALRLVLRYPWPLNVRELKRALLAAVDLASPDEENAPVRICAHHLPQAVQELRPPAPAGGGTETAVAAHPPRGELTAAEQQLRDTVVENLRRANGNVSDVARQMGKGRTQIQRWIARFGIDVDALRRLRG